MGGHGDAWTCMETHGEAWRRMDMHGDTWRRKGTRVHAGFLGEKQGDSGGKKWEPPAARSALRWARLGDTRRVGFSACAAEMAPF